MNSRTRWLACAAAVMLASMWVAADDGALLRKNLSNAPDYESEFAGVEVLRFYVPAQASDGTLLTTGITYYDYTTTTSVFTRTEAKPLVAAFVDGHVDGFVGQRDAFGAVSFDDGASWKKTNLSQSGTKAIKVATGGKPIKSYGDVFRMYHASAGNKVMAVWVSRYCDQGDPAYNLADGTTLDPLTGLPYADIYGVKGSQRYVDYTRDYPEVGVVPYGCVWTARGTVETTADGKSVMLWRQAERLTSGVRDAHRIEISCAEHAGCAVTWQEDPQGLRPGDGEGPGEGWSGAVANQGTDVWYSWMDWANFVPMTYDGTTVVDAATVLATGGVPKVYARMSIPVRLTDNEKCAPLADGDEPSYCHVALDSNADGVAELTLCSGETVTYTNAQGAEVTACVSSDGRVMDGQTASTRARINLQPYTTTDGDVTTTSAWVVVQYEENKALGEIDLDADGEADEIGKNNRYMSFEMRRPEVIRQGLQLNSPTVPLECVDTPLDTSCFLDWNTTAPDLLAVDDTLYDTEIARRASLVTQSPAMIAASVSRTSATPLFKQGVIKAGGPADIMMRRFVAPAPTDPTLNPYDEKNMVCDGNGDGINDPALWLFTDGSNPNYLDGLCIAPPINLSGTVATLCENADCGYQITDPDLTDDDTGASLPVPKVLEWAQFPGSTSETAPADGTTLNDQSWENALDVAKGHRGFLDGDFVMILYAWSPNWKANAIGNDRYDLYVRRSFDGGVTWTTTPAALNGIDPDGDGPAPAVVANGTTTCELFRSNMLAPVCTTYGAGAPEQARNVSLLSSLQTTILDPRYSPTPASILSDTDADGVADAAAYQDDLRDASRYFIVYETGDNYLVSLGAEALPLDLYYSQAVNFGDDYTGFPHALSTLTTPTYVGATPLYAMPQFDAIESNKDLLSGEASIKATPSGMFLHATWNQWQEDLATEIITNSDAWYRRIMFLDDRENPMPTGGGTTGGGGGGKPPKKK